MNKTVRLAQQTAQVVTLPPGTGAAPDCRARGPCFRCCESTKSSVQFREVLC